MELLTPRGLAGVAVLRAAAGERAAVLAALRGVDAASPFAPRPGAPQRAVLQLGELAVDDVLVVDRGPRGLELHVHGAEAVVAALERAFSIGPAAPASPAERLLRAALADEQLELALEQREFDFARECAAIAALAPGPRRAAVAAARARSRIALAMVEPLRVVLVGAQNAGKSTLFNRLLCRERVLTGPLPGLTRDPVAEDTALAGYPYTLVDTAGEGPAAAAVDAAAIARGRAQRDGALALLVVDGARGPTPVDLELAAQCALVVANKVDRPRAPWPAGLRCDLAVSAAADALAPLRRAVGELLRGHRALPRAGAVGGFAALTRVQLAALEALD